MPAATWIPSSPLDSKDKKAGRVATKKEGLMTPEGARRAEVSEVTLSTA